MFVQSKLHSFSAGKIFALRMADSRALLKILQCKCEITALLDVFFGVGGRLLIYKKRFYSASGRGLLCWHFLIDFVSVRLLLKKTVFKMLVACSWSAGKFLQCWRQMLDVGRQTPDVLESFRAWTAGFCLVRKLFCAGSRCWVC
jgi:hypothetical protein